MPRQRSLRNSRSLGTMIKRTWSKLSTCPRFLESSFQREESAVTQFTDLQTFYEYVQQHALDHARAGEIARLAQRLRDYAHERAEEDMERKAQWEVDLFNFRIEDGQAGPLWRGVDEGGNEVPYPDLDSYGDDALDYVQERLGGATNPLVVARCATVLWSSRRKHHRFGHAAVNALLELARAFEARDQTLPDGHYGLRVLDCIRNAWALSRQTKHRVEDVAAEMRRLILEFSYESSSSFALRLNLIELMLDGRRWISDQHFAGFVDVCWRVSGDPDCLFTQTPTLGGQKLETTFCFPVVAGHAQTGGPDVG